MKLKSIIAMICFIFLINFCITPIFTVTFATESIVDDEPSNVVSDEPSEVPVSQPSEPDEPSEIPSEPDEPVSSESPVISETPSESPSSRQSTLSEVLYSSTVIEYPSPSSSIPDTPSSTVPYTSQVESQYIPEEPIYVVSIPEDTSSNVSSDVSSSDDTSSWEESSSEEEMVLPDVSISDISVPQVIGSVTDDGRSSKDNLVKGMIAWVCIGIGVVLVLTVIFGSSYSKQSAKNKRVKGRKHYKASKNKHKKRLLSDRYIYR